MFAIIAFFVSAIFLLIEKDLAPSKTRYKVNM